MLAMTINHPQGNPVAEAYASAKDAIASYHKAWYASLSPSEKRAYIDRTNAARRVRRASRARASAADLASAFSYDPATGRVWRTRDGYEGYLDRLGYRWFAVGDFAFPAHRIAWAVMTGAFPAGIIDHRNGVPGDNRWENIRDATRAANTRNIGGPYKTNKSGYLGVSPKGKGWAATIMVGGKNRYLGTFATPEDASAAYLAAKAALHPECERLSP